MEQTSQAYDHVIIIDTRSFFLLELKQKLSDLNYANHISCFENPKVGIKYIRNCKKIPEVVFFNLMQMTGPEFINSFIMEFKSLSKFIIISSSKNSMELIK
jgi:hypothetical protein